MLVRINLSPDRKRKQKRNAMHVLVLILACILVVEVIAAFVWVNHTNSKINTISSVVARKTAEKTELESKLSEAPKLQEKLTELYQRELTLARLASVRTGPHHVLDELARILTHPRDALQMNAAREAGWLLAWDVENVMLQSFDDLGNGKIVIRGQARSMDDISEFWLRLKTSSYFRNIRLGEIKDGRKDAVGGMAQEFSFDMEANFSYQTKEGAALLEMLAESGEDQDAEAPEESAL